MFQLNPATGVPIYEQIINNITELIAAGVMKPGDKIPPVRILAEQLGINPNTAAKAYRILEKEGKIVTTIGRGSFISEDFDSKKAIKAKIASDMLRLAQKAMNVGMEKDLLIVLIDSVYEGGQ